MEWKSSIVDISMMYVLHSTQSTNIHWMSNLCRFFFFQCNEPRHLMRNQKDKWGDSKIRKSWRKSSEWSTKRNDTEKGKLGMTMRNNKETRQQGIAKRNDKEKWRRKRNDTEKGKIEMTKRNSKERSQGIINEELQRRTKKRNNSEEWHIYIYDEEE